jgi:xylan 1,4-beta-xylosidase
LYIQLISKRVLDKQFVALFPNPLSSLYSVFKVAALAVVVFVLSVTAGCQSGAVRPDSSKADISLREVRVDASRVMGTIRSFQGVNGAPVPLRPGLVNVSAAFRDVGVDLVRTHDYFGPADIDAKWSRPDRAARSNRASWANVIFPNPAADPDKETSYNFGPTDRIIQAIVANGAEVYFRIGRSWSADPDPPADFDKFATIVKRVAIHYNQGWANGFRLGIRHWEFWNEPDVEAPSGLWLTEPPWLPQPFWSGTPQQFYLLYEKTGRALKAMDPAIKVGACGTALAHRAGPYREGLMRYCAKRGVPLDFFSWHHYHDSSFDPYDMVRIGAEYRRLLDSFGLKSCEIDVTEWNMSLPKGRPGHVDQVSTEAAAFTAAALIYLQDSALARSLYYRGDAGPPGLFDGNGRYRKKAYAFKAVGTMLKSPERLAATGGDTLGFAVLAGKSKDGRIVQVIISNHEIPPDRRGKNLHPNPSQLPRQKNILYRNNSGYSLTVTGLPWGESEFEVKRFRLSYTEDFAMVEEASGRGGTFTLAHSLPPPGLELIVLRQK